MRRLKPAKTKGLAVSAAVLVVTYFLSFPVLKMALKLPDAILPHGPQTVAVDKEGHPLNWAQLPVDLER